MTIILQIIMQLISAGVAAIIAYFVLRERIVKLEARYEAHVDKIQDIMGKLEKGSKAIDKLDDSINTLNLTLVELKTVIRERQ